MSTLTGKLATGSDLRTGLVVFLTRQGTWSPDINQACVGEEEQSWQGLERKALEDAAAGLVVDVYLVDVERTSRGIRPLHIRERIRTLGPTVRTDLGKQADGIAGAPGPVELAER